MAKSKAKAPHRKPQQSKTLSDLKKSPGESPFEKYQDYIYVGIIILAVLVFFSEGVFSGKIFASPDNLSPFSFRTFLDEASANGIFPLWVPYIFGGMPSLASLTTGLPAANNFFSFIWDSIWNSFAGDNLFKLTLPYYLLFAISTYFYTRHKFKNNTVALFCALCGVLATGIIQLIIVGHHTKMMTFAFFPLVLLAIDMMIDSGLKDWKKYMIYLPIVAILMYLQLHFHHIQMLFYSYMMIAIYYGYILVYRIVKKTEFMTMVKALLVIIAGGVIAVAMDANILMSVKEYNNYSMRGQAGIEALNNPATQNNSPLDYQYATNWSFSPGEVLTFVVPYYFGFGNVEVNGQRMNTYWGQMPFTDSPVYFGVIVFLLALIGIFMNFRRTASVQALTITAVLFLFLSFGRTWPIIFDLFFNHFPFFGSFRAPVMIHYYLDFIFLILAGYGFKSILEAAKDKVKQESFKKLSFVLMGLAGLMFIISLIGFEGSYKETVLSGPKVSELKQSYPPDQVDNYFNQQVIPSAYENAVSDMRLHSILLLVVLISAYFYTQKKTTAAIFGAIVIVIAVFDLWNISSKTLHWDTAQDKETMFAKSDYVNFLLSSDPDTYRYRIAEYNGGKMATSNILAYYKLHLFNGYHGAKIRNYQDAIDVAGDMNPSLLDLGNVKYIITDQPIPDTNRYTPVFQGKSKLVYQNNNYLPRAFFVDEYRVESGLNILTAMRDGTFNPRTTALLEENPGAQIDKPDSSASAIITDFGIHHINYDVNATGNNMLVFSEIYYPAGWKAYIDGQETQVYKTDYLFRSIIVPAGQHKVEFKFDPAAYSTGKSISLAANVFVILLLVAGIGGTFMSKKEKHEEKKSAGTDDNEEVKSDEA